MKMSTAMLAAQAVAVRDLLSDQKRWIQESLARNSSNHEVSPIAASACKFCLVGAIAHVTRCTSAPSNAHNTPLGTLIDRVIRGVQVGKGVYPDALDEEKYLANLPSYYNVYSYNDDHTHQDLMEVLHTAVAVAQGAVEAGVEVE